MNLDYKNSALVDDKILNKFARELEPIIKAVTQAFDNGYQTPYAFVNMPQDNNMLEMVKKVVAQKKSLNPHVLVVIGIGGSHLGTAAIQQAVYGRFYNEQLPETKIFYADTVDTDYIWDIVLVVEQELEAGHTVLLNVISKSGTTTETIANYEIFLELFRKYYKEAYHDYIVITTDEHSPLWHIAHKENVQCLIIPKLVGGRYSVFSPVGLFPLGMIGINIDQLILGAQQANDVSIKTDIYQNPALLSAVLIYAHYEQGVRIHDLFLFSLDLYSIGMWYRQLVAESLGKDGKGILPTISMGTSDLHSIAQLYVGGPKDRFTTFMTVIESKSNIVLPTYPEFEKLVANMQGLPLSSIMQAIFDGVCATYHKRALPFVTMTIAQKSAFYIGQLLQMMMFEVVYTGHLLDVNPFDQPDVERYKSETKNRLAERKL